MIRLRRGRGLAGFGNHGGSVAGISTVAVVLAGMSFRGERVACALPVADDRP